MAFAPWTPGFMSELMAIFEKGIFREDAPVCAYGMRLPGALALEGRCPAGEGIGLRGVGGLLRPLQA